MERRSHIIPLFLLIVISLIAVWSGLNPTDRAVWYAEVIPIFVVLGLLVFTYTRFQFSGLAYFLMSLWMIMHFIGAKYTFANVPFEWINGYVTPFLGEDRNHFDRIAHFIIGFYSFPMAEWLLRKRKCGLGVAFFFSLFFIMSVAAAYEIIEWQYAVIEGGNAGIEFLGSQGDIWDAQKDMLADTLGAITALFIYLIARPDLRLRDYY
ncbi:DUF2238 domain-containing protein [Muribacter muris]|uniref:DUF2238 domain-containing protein n=1 Tax=Muribacter muris TaxID=67855 RepID=A0A4Y9K2N3_9PAST|nr:DUF2238 domain-containing protein [Muribacter muris]MBF0784494.1 DUF2238 domain-containing protein [Muribacter muris]MBF0826210.1 DUF2238 domain-containing protein [Muribacter muris]TFV12008.1 DUF2238 domain-containing protein [Muribacter muris]